MQPYINEIDSMTNMKYILFYSLAIKPKSLNVERQCVQFILEDFTKLTEYIKNAIRQGGSFYMIDYDFWHNWLHLTPGSEDVLVINSKKLVEYLDKPKRNLVYLQDYVLLPAKMYRLFKSWYEINGRDITVEVREVKGRRCEYKVN